MSPGSVTKSFARMPRWMRITAIVLAVVVVLGLIIPYFIDVDRYRTAIAVAIENATGRKVTIGKIRARLLPRAGFVVEDFHLGNPRGFAEGEVLSVEAIHGNLALLPLLGGKLELSSIELVHPKLTLLTDDRGDTNYSTGETPADGRRKETSPASAPAASSSFQLSEVDHIDFTGAEVILGQVTGRGRNIVPSLDAKKISVRLSQVALDPLVIKRWKAEVPVSGVTVEIPGWKEPLEFRSGQLNLHDGRIESEFRARLGKAADFKGTLNVANIEEAVSKFELNTTELDVDQLLALQGEMPPAAPAHPRPARSELVAQGKVTAERIQWQPYRGNNASVEIRIFNDRIEVWPMVMELYGGTLQVSARADRAQSPARFSSNIQVRNVDVGKMLSVASPSMRGKLFGTGEVDLQLFGSLGPSFAKSLTGTGRFNVRDGRLPGINLPGGLEALGKLGIGGDTPFRSIAGDLSIQNSRIASRQIHLDSPSGTVDLHGSSGFDGTLDYDGQANVDLAGGLAGGSQNPAGQIISGVLGNVVNRNVGRRNVAFAVRGTFSEMKVYPTGRGAALPTQAAPAQPDKKKSILDLFRKP